MPCINKEKKEKKKKLGYATFTQLCVVSTCACAFLRRYRLTIQIRNTDHVSHCKELDEPSMEYYLLIINVSLNDDCTSNI